MELLVETNAPYYVTIPVWCARSGMSRSGTYAELGRKNLKAIKVGSRTLINFNAGIAWMSSLPAAQIQAPRQAA